MQRSLKIRMMGSMDDIKEFLDYLDELGVNYTPPKRLYFNYGNQDVRAYIEVYGLNRKPSMALDTK